MWSGIMSWQKEVMNETVQKVSLEKNEAQIYNECARMLYSIMQTNYNIRKAVDENAKINCDIDSTVSLIHKHNIDISPFKVSCENSKLYVISDNTRLSAYRLHGIVEYLRIKTINDQNTRKMCIAISTISAAILLCFFYFYIFG